MKCLDWQERIALYAGGDAAADEAEEVERHMGGCPPCREFASAMKESLEELREFHTEIPEAAHFTAVRSRVLAEIGRSRQVWRRLAWISGVAAMVLVTFALWPRPGTVPVPPRIAAVIPSAPLVAHATPAPLPRRQVAKARQDQRAPLTVRLQTSDPNIVIYWIAD